MHGIVRTFAVVGTAVVVAACGSTRAAAPKPTTTTAPAVAPDLAVTGHAGAAYQLSAKYLKEPEMLTTPGDRAAVVSAESRFGLGFLNRVLAGAGSDNVALSPYSLMAALSMLENGAQGNTLTQIQATLGTAAVTPHVQDAEWSEITRTLTADAGSRITLSTANSIWQQQGLGLEEAFMSALSAYFAAGVWQVDFARHLDAAVAALNTWTAQNTAGKITQLFNPGDLDQATALVLANALYLKADWATPFEASKSGPAPFVTAAGATINPTFMSGDAMGTASGSPVRVARLPYQGGQIEADVLMPTTQKLPAFISRLTPASFSAAIGRATTAVNLNLPKFTMEADLPLKDGLKAAGMPDAFDPSKADFGALSPTPLYVSAAVQRDYLKVDELGTEAAAVTGLAMTPTAARINPPPDLTIDHPFLFVIRDVPTGILLFTAAVQAPA